MRPEVRKSNIQPMLLTPFECLLWRRLTSVARRYRRDAYPSSTEKLREAYDSTGAPVAHCTPRIGHVDAKDLIQWWLRFVARNWML